jgi:hypothetical protein
MSNRISDEISNRRSASADLETHINTVSNAVSVVSAQLNTLSTNFTSTNAQLSNAWSAINRLSNVISSLGGTNIDAISNSLSVISAAFVSQSDRVSAISAQMFSINTVVSNLTSNVLSIDTKLSNAVSVVSAAYLSGWNAISNEISVRGAASADLKSAINVVSNAVSVVSAAQLSTQNAISNEISVRAAASADLKSAINVVSNAVSVVSAQVATNSAQMTSANNAISNAVSVVSVAAAAKLPLAGGTLTGTVTSRAITPSTDNTYNLGTASTGRYATVYAVTFSGAATTAQYADLAEKYLADAEYEVGTVVVIGGSAEVTQSQTSHNNSVLGVVSGKPAYLMNSDSAGASIALTGRVPCFVKGPVRKGDVMVTSDIPGRAQTLDVNKFMPGCVLGKALESTDNELDTIEIVVGIH